MLNDTALSVLDLSPIVQGGDATIAFNNTRSLARYAEGLGYKRYWLAEHHNMPGLGCAATAVLIGNVAEATKTLKVGAGGIMLPNHAPLIIAEQFGTLAALYPGRIELGLGRAPGTDQITMRALRRQFNNEGNSFPRDILELQSYFGREVPGVNQEFICAVPGQELDIPIWILGSSLYGAQLAAAMGLPYGFASHFSPSLLMQALEVYRNRFEPSDYLNEPYVLAGFNVFAAENDVAGQTLMSSAQQAFLNLRNGRPSKLQPPISNFENNLTSEEKAVLKSVLSCSVAGGAETVKDGLKTFIEQTGVDEVMIAAQIFDHNARLKSYEIVAEVFKEI